MADYDEDNDLGPNRQLVVPFGRVSLDAAPVHNPKPAPVVPAPVESKPVAITMAMTQRALKDLSDLLQETKAQVGGMDATLQAATPPKGKRVFWQQREDEAKAVATYTTARERDLKLLQAVTPIIPLLKDNDTIVNNGIAPLFARMGTAEGGIALSDLILETFNDKSGPIGARAAQRKAAIEKRLPAWRAIFGEQPPIDLGQNPAAAPTTVSTAWANNDTLITKGPLR